LVEDMEVIPVKFFRKLSGTKLYEIRVEWKSNIYIDFRASFIKIM